MKLVAIFLFFFPMLAFSNVQSQEALFEVGEIKKKIPNIIINKESELKLSTKKIEVEIEDPEWGVGDQIIVSFKVEETKVISSSKPTKSTEKTKEAKKEVKGKSITVKKAIALIKSGKEVDNITIPFSTYIKIGPKNRKVLGNRITIRGDDGLDYKLYKGRVTTRVPVDIDTLISLFAEAIEYDKVARLKYIKGRSIANPESISKILQLVEASPFSKENNKAIATAIGIDADSPEFLTLLDIYANLGGEVIKKDGKLPRIASYPRVEDSVYKVVKAKKTNFYSEFDDFVIIRHGAYVLNEKYDLKSWFGGRAVDSLFSSIWMFADWERFSNERDFNNWKEGLTSWLD